MKYKKIDLTGPRCKECNELIPKNELKNLDKYGGICSWCIDSRMWLRLRESFTNLVLAGWLEWESDAPDED